jgi:hypothetical protein
MILIQTSQQCISHWIVNPTSQRHLNFSSTSLQQNDIKTNPNRKPGVITLAGAATSCFARITPAVVENAVAKASTRSFPVPREIIETVLRLDNVV